MKCERCQCDACGFFRFLVIVTCVTFLASGVVRFVARVVWP